MCNRNRQEVKLISYHDLLNNFNLATSKMKNELKIETTKLKSESYDTLGRKNNIVPNSSNNKSKIDVKNFGLNICKSNIAGLNEISNRLNENAYTNMKNLKNQLEKSKFMINKETFKSSNNLLTVGNQLNNPQVKHKKQISEFPLFKREIKVIKESNGALNHKERIAVQPIAKMSSLCKMNQQIFKKLEGDTQRKSQSKESLNKSDLKHFESRSNKENQLGKAKQIIAEFFITSNYKKAIEIKVNYIKENLE